MNISVTHTGCTWCTVFLLLIRLFWSVPGPPVGVGMNIDIASIDMVSEVNMVSRPLSPLYLWQWVPILYLWPVLCINQQGKYPPKPLGKPLSMQVCVNVSLTLDHSHRLVGLRAQRQTVILFEGWWHELKPLWGFGIDWHGWTICLLVS